MTDERVATEGQCATDDDERRLPTLRWVLYLVTCGWVSFQLPAADYHRLPLYMPPAVPPFLYGRD